MNTFTKSAALILALGLGLSNVASATEELMSRQRASEARNTNQPVVEEGSGWRHTLGTPFRYAGRVGKTVTPMIVGETLTGDRQFISRDGFMTRTSESKPQAAPAENSAVSINMGAGTENPCDERLSR